MDFETVIAERYSVRKFEDIHLPQEVVDRILQAGIWHRPVVTFNPSEFWC